MQQGSLGQPNKKSSFFQYELEHNNFPSAKEYVIAEDEQEDSPQQFRRQKYAYD